MSKVLNVGLVLIFVVFAYLAGVCAKAWSFTSGLDPQIGFTKLSFSVDDSGAEIESAARCALQDVYGESVHCIVVVDESAGNGNILLVDEQGEYFRARSEVVRFLKKRMESTGQVRNVSVHKRQASILREGLARGKQGQVWTLDIGSKGHVSTETGSGLDIRHSLVPAESFQLTASPLCRAF